MAGSTLPERVAQIYYTYGLFCSSYPVTAITLALSVVLVCCFPLLNVPLPGNIPTTVVLPLYEVSNAHSYVKPDCSNNKCPSTVPPFSLEILQNETQKLPYVWAKEKPLLYVQQIVMKIGVSPWTSNLKMWDAFRAPLQEVFRLLETVRNHEDIDTKTSLAHRCYQIEGIKRPDSRASVDRLLPEYGCLLLSPANLWQQNLQAFSLDANILNTIHTYHKGKPSISELAFGMHLRDTGVKRYPLRRRPRILQYALTVFFQHYDQRFLESLSKKLKEQYPLYQEPPYSHTSEATLIYYPGQFNYRELVPLTITFVGLFLYVYFSVRKIEFINSKFGLAACSVLTIAGSLTMSMGICFYFGFSLSLQGKEIFPYLVIIVGLENVLVLTKSVTGTDSRLDVKIRLAQGLSKEGWSITKNLLTEITIFTVSFFTFVPFIQEFSIFMIVSLLSDYFVQMVFFATILGIDVRRMDYFREQNSKLHLKEYFHANNAFNWRCNGYDDNFSPQRMTKSKSHPRLNGLSNSPTDVVAKRNSNSGSQERVPKRIRLVNLWARTRFFQRAFMVWMIVWISMIVYNSGVVEYFIASADKSEKPVVKSGPKVSEARHSMPVFYKANESSQVVFSPLIDAANSDKSTDDVNDTILLKHSPHSRPWSRLSSYHWSSIITQYNQSVAGRYAVVLPPLLLSHRVSPELAAGVRHPDEKDPPPLRWQALAAALDPIDIISDLDLMESKSPLGRGPPADLPIYPTTPMEILLLAILCSISVAVIAYMMVVLYRCICSRHYAEWRASWNGDENYDKNMSKQPAVQLVMEAVPIVVAGHAHEVECLATDGERVASSCLRGSVRVWDPAGGDLLTSIDRDKYFKLQKDLYDKINSRKDSNTYEIEEVIPKEVITTTEKYPRLRKGLDSHLSGLRFRANQQKDTSHLPAAEKTKYEFAKNYRELYCSAINDDFYGTCDSKDNAEIISNNTNIKDPNNHTDSNCNDRLSHQNSHAERKANGNVGHSEKRHNSDVPVNDNEVLVNDSDVLVNGVELASDWRSRAVTESPVWCMDLCNDLIVLGCADGRLEFWEANMGKLLCIWWGECRARAWSGITCVRALSGARRAVAVTLGGHVTLLRLTAVNAASGQQVDWRFSTAHRRTHKRTGSAGAISARAHHEQRGRMSFSYDPEPSEADEVVCSRVAHARAHQQPVTELQVDGGRVLTGGQDHVLKVFSASELTPLFTLHGHCGPISASFIDHASPHIAGSGSQDGLLCVWDLHTGACLYSTQAHDGSVTSLAYSASYVISAGADERLCIWDRFQGHMLNSVHIGLNYMSRMLPLTHSLLVMGDRSGLVTYDLSTGDVIRRVLLGESDSCILVRQILPLKDAIVCDFSNQLRIVRFPLVSKLANIKSD